MFIPFGTDAPIYHRPWATIALITLNVLVFFGFGAAGSRDALADWVLAFGDGLHPLQWVSNGFLHAGFGHLFGNMLFLWTFGMVVEGKIGWQRFLLVYLGIGIAQSALIQLCMLGARPGGALGASSAIMGIMAIAFIWAPRNEVECWFSVFPPITYDLPIYVVIGFFVGWDILSAMMSGFAMSTETLHASGVLMGAPLGLLMVKRGLVDCEGWDLVTILKHGRPLSAGDRLRASPLPARRAGLPPGAQAARLPAPAAAGDPELRAGFESRMRAAIAAGDGAATEQLLAEGQRQCGTWGLPGDIVQALAHHYLAQKEWGKAGEQLRDAIARFPDEQGGAGARLALAQIYVLRQKRPAKALDILQALTAEDLTGAQRDQLVQLKAHARAEIAQGVLEMDD